MTKETTLVAPIMTPAEVMEWLKIKRTKLYDLIDQGLPYHSLSANGRTKVFYPAEIQAWLDSRGRSRIKTEEAPSMPRRGRPPKQTGEAPPRKWIKR